jgi:hypothetical protein
LAKLVSLLVLFVVLTAQPAATQPAPTENLTLAADSLLATLAGPAEREQARPLLHRMLWNYCDEMLRVIPRNSPRDNDWVQGEIDSADFARVNRITATVEYSRYNLTKVFTNCKDLTSKLIYPSSPSAAIASRALDTLGYDI